MIRLEGGALVMSLPLESSKIAAARLRECKCKLFVGSRKNLLPNALLSLSVDVHSTSDHPKYQFYREGFLSASDWQYI